MGKELQVVSALPDDCWELIFRKVQGRDLRSISLVCKHFLSISNVCHNRAVTIYSPKHTFIPQLFARFKNINKIFLSAYIGSLSETLFALATSGINLQTLIVRLCSRCLPIPNDGWKELGLAMKNLNYLHCPNFYRLNDYTLSVIASSMTSLKVLNMGTEYKQYMPLLPRVSDRGIEILAASLPQLEEIDISGFSFLSDDSFVALSSKCKFLRVVKADGLPKITHHGIGYVLAHSLHLENLSCKRHPGKPEYAHEVLRKLNCEITYEKASGSMRFTHGNLLNHELIGSIVKAKIPLKKLHISQCQHINNVRGLIAFLTGHPSLTCLEIESYYHLDLISDNFIADLCPYLSNMKSICFIAGKLNLGRSSFLNLAKSCLSLEEFRVESSMNKPVFTWLSSEPYSLDDDSVNGAEQKIRQAYQCSLF